MCLLILSYILLFFKFQIRIDDAREFVKTGKVEIADILVFYNSATDALLKQYAKEVRVIQGSTAWKTAIVYEHILRAIDNIGINAAYVIKFFLRGVLSNEETVQYIRSKILFLDYLEQASSFSPVVDRRLKMIRNGKNYRKLLEM